MFHSETLTSQPSARKNKEIPSEWFKELTPEQEAVFRKQLVEAEHVLNVLKNILKRRYEAVHAERQPDNNPNWAYRMAYKQGRAAEIEDLYRLLP